MKSLKLHTVAMIPARLQATRFPGKLLQDLGGMSVIARTYINTKATGLFDEVIVVTDSREILNDITKHGGKAMMSQREHSCGSDRIAEAVANIDTDIVVNVQGDEPFTDKTSLSPLLEVFEDDHDRKIDLASLMTPLNDPEDIQNPNYVKVIVNNENFALYFSRSPIPYHRNKSFDIQYFRHKGIYAFRKQAILEFSKMKMQPLEMAEQIECIRFLEYGKSIKMIETNENSFGIDTPQDLVRAKLYLNQLK
jgi:3-deoxy-manno-octulosonate cytidylyltransferase (CMP-KDO synthetase)